MISVEVLSESINGGRGWMTFDVKICRVGLGRKKNQSLCSGYNASTFFFFCEFLKATMITCRTVLSRLGFLLINVQIRLIYVF